MKIKIFSIYLFLFFFSFSTFAQKSLQNQISDTLTVIANQYSYVGVINNVKLSSNSQAKLLTVTVSDRLSYIPFRDENVAWIYDAIKSIVGSQYPNYRIKCLTNQMPIEELIPNYYRSRDYDQSRRFKLSESHPPLISKESLAYKIDRGLENRHIALWQSHGWYYNINLRRWEWQRPRLFQTVEDLLTQSFVLPFLVPMLENAGANVLIPLERDTQRNEVIVDNDKAYSKKDYLEIKGKKEWIKGSESGFADTKTAYLYGDNPFTFGSYRETTTTSSEDDASFAEWLPDIPEAGNYAVYVSYKSLENSTSDAKYSVFHLGGKTDFSVNQNMGGGTWIYLGHFQFAKGRNNLSGKVVLSNFSATSNKVITADAVKFGGGMGNIARSPGDSSKVSIRIMQPIEKMINICPVLIHLPPMFPAEKSGYPRFAEGARYWLQWAGAPDSIYSRTENTNDYSDDFQSRGFWVNYLAGASSALPTEKGLAVPIDLAFAFHTDAGATVNDSIIGSLGIFTVQNNDKKTQYKNKVSRWAARDLTDIVQTQIIEDIRKQYAAEWTRRNMWNKSYSESRVPEVPTMLLELLAHQNFADMRYALDPRFQFTVSRAIYKGMLRYLSEANGFDYVVQPLPVEEFYCRFVDKEKVELQWKAVEDSLESSASAEKYVLYTRIDDGGFDNGTLIKHNKTTVDIKPGRIYSFKVTAVNRGGESFPSEILSAYRAPNDLKEVLIVNAFERLSAPASFVADTTYAGFLNDKDAGVPYISNIGFTGKQYEFKRNTPWNDNDAPGFGASYANEEAKVIAGNSFDYPYLHGNSIKSAGYSFVSSSVKAVEKGKINLKEYKIVDLILGKQKQTRIGNGKRKPEFKTFSSELQQQIRSYCNNGGSLLVTGAHIGSDLCEGDSVLNEDIRFFENVLKSKFRTSNASTDGRIKMVNSTYRLLPELPEFNYYSFPNEKSYYVESPDAIEPAITEASTIYRYSENNRSAAIAYKGNYRLCLFGFPFETIVESKNRDKLMSSVLLFFQK